MKKRSMQGGYYPAERPKKKKSRGTLFVVLIIIAAVVYIYFSRGGSLNSVLPGFFNATSSNSGSPNALIQKCNQQVENCGNVIKAKYESSLAILKNVKVNTTLGANEFLKTWGPASQVSSISYYDSNFPVVLVATRMDNSDGSKTPHVFVCKSDGTLEEKSISGLC